jgi:hypothetical protein
VFSLFFVFRQTFSSLVAVSSCSALGYRVSFLEPPFPHNLSLAAASSSSVLFCSVFFLSFFLFFFFLLGWEQFSEFSERVCFRKMPRKEQRYTTSPNITRTGDNKRERERERERERLIDRFLGHYACCLFVERTTNCSCFFFFCVFFFRN